MAAVADLRGPVAELGIAQRNAVLMAWAEAGQITGFTFAEPLILDDHCDLGEKPLSIVWPPM